MTSAASGMVRSASKIGDIALRSCIMNSSSFAASSLDDLANLAAQKGSGAITSRTALIDAFEENDTHKHAFFNGSSSINSYGYSPHPISYYYNGVDDLRRKFGKPLFVSVTGSPDEVASILHQAGDRQSFDAPDAIEVNLSCPNIASRPPISYTAEMQTYLQVIGEFKSSLDSVSSPNIMVGVKIAPSLFESQFVEQSDMINARPPDFVTAINTVGNGLYVDVDSHKPIVPTGYGGIGGDAVRAIALGNVRRLYTLLDPTIDIIGCGGISSGADAFRHILCGAKAVQLATSILHNGAEVMTQIHEELEELMTAQGISCVEDFRGALEDGHQNSRGFAKPSSSMSSL